MPRIAILEGWDALPTQRASRPSIGGNMARRRKRKSGKVGQRAKFKRVAKICNKKKGKAARKACWRSHYR
jgi:hypothetical protein